MELSVAPSPHFKSHGGFVIPAVLLIAALGVLFGLGRLMMYRYQCQLRIDRQHEIEKQDAVKSMLNWLRCNPIENIAETNELKVVTESGRELKIISIPTPVLFPNGAAYNAASPDNHFSLTTYGKYSALPAADVKYANTGIEFLKLLNGQYAQTFGLRIISQENENAPLLQREKVISPVVLRDDRGRPLKDQMTNQDRLYFGGMTNKGDRSALSIEMARIGGWWNDEYGRRYEVTFDAMASNAYHRIYLMRKSTPWPLRGNDVAICLEFIPGCGGEMDNVMQAFYYKGERPLPVLSKDGGPVIRRGREESNSNSQPLSSNGPKGIQLAGHYLSIFGATAENYIFSNNIGYLDEDVYKKLTSTSESDLADNGDLKMIVEVECRNGSIINTLSTVISKIEVSPAYKFDIYLEYPIDSTRRFGEPGRNWQLATVAQPCTPDRANANPIVITYDTHGTENKGFRKDEREAERKRNRR